MAKASIVYVGTADGLVTLSDPGGSGQWRKVNQALEGQAINAVTAEDALNLLVHTATGAYRSEDGGQTWVPAPDAPTQPGGAGPMVATAQGMARWTGAHAPHIAATAIAMLSGNQEILLAATAEGVLRSENGGTQWQAATLDTTLTGIVTVIMPASYHMDQAWLGTASGQLLRTLDRGRSWQPMATLGAGILSLVIVRLA